MPIQPSKKAVSTLKSLNATFRLRMQFLENPESVELRAARRQNHQDVPLPEGEYRTHVEIIDVLTGKSYINVMGESGEPEIQIIDRACAAAIEKGRPATQSDYANTEALVTENAALRQQLAELQQQNQPRSKRLKTAAVGDED